MALDIPHPNLKRDLDSFVDECSVPLDHPSLSDFSTEISKVKMDYQSNIPPSPPMTTPSSAQISSVSTDHVAPIQPPMKKTKLMQVEHHEKEAQPCSKAEEKRQKEKLKEAERQRKEIERKKKEIEREEKRAAQEIEKQAKEEKRRKIEEEKKRRDEERDRKERNQLKLKSFFAAPTPASTPPVYCLEAKGYNQSTDSPYTNEKNAISGTLTINSAESQPTPYYKLFPEFFIQSGVTLAPCNRFEGNKDRLKRAQENIDLCLKNASYMDRKPVNLCDMLNLSHHDTIPRGKLFKPVRMIMEDFYSGKHVGLKDGSKSNASSHNPLKRIPMKFLKFYEDVRPPYVGTYTFLPIGGSKKLARNPLRKNLPNKDYDYDSEAEWVEDDGEEIKSDEEEEEPDDDEDIDEFLDDENDDLVNSRHIEISGDLEPISTGLCWEDENSHNSNAEMAMYRMEFILDLNMNSIDPFLSSYWAPRTSETPAIYSNSISESKFNGIKNTINLLTLRSDKPFFSSNLSSPYSSLSQVPTTSGKCKNKDFTQTTKLLPTEDMEDFKSAIVGSDLSKVGLIEVLKRRFPGRPAAVIKATLEVTARRGQKGQKEAEKRWVLI